MRTVIVVVAISQAHCAMATLGSQWTEYSEAEKMAFMEGFRAGIWYSGDMMLVLADKTDGLSDCFPWEEDRDELLEQQLDRLDKSVVELVFVLSHAALSLISVSPVESNRMLIPEIDKVYLDTANAEKFFWRVMLEQKKGLWRD